MTSLELLPCPIETARRILNLPSEMELTQTQRAMLSIAVEVIKGRDLEYHTRAASPSEWQDIESAPKDGTSILAAIRGYKTITLVYWNVHYKKWCTISENETPDFYDDGFFTLWHHMPPPPNNHNQGEMK